MSARDIQALTFDVFGTVVDWRGSIIRAGEALGRELGRETDWPGLADAWRALYQPAMAKVRERSRPWTRLDDLHRENLIAILPRFGLSDLDQAAIERLNRAWHALDPWPDAVAGLTRLKRRFILSTLSNGDVAIQVRIARHGGLPWDFAFGAELAQSFKPDPKVYRKAAQLLGLRPEQCLMVAAHPADLDAARTQGFGTAYVHRPLEYGAARARPMPQTDFDYAVESFTELADRLGC